MLRVPLVASTGRPGYRFRLLAVLVIVAVAHRRLGPSPSATTSTWSVRSPAKLTLASVMVCLPLVPGRAVCPALGTRGRWTPRHAERPPGASDEANDVDHRPSSPAIRRLGCRLGWRRLRLGSGMPAPSGQIPPPWGVVGERGSHHADCWQSVPGNDPAEIYVKPMAPGSARR
jgi:hypothetical protein